MESIKDILIRMMKEWIAKLEKDVEESYMMYDTDQVIGMIEYMIKEIENTPEPSHNQIQKNLRQQVGELKSENSALNEKLQNYIPRRRVRRVYKQIKKILEQDGITDDLDIEE